MEIKKAPTLLEEIESLVDGLKFFVVEEFNKIHKRLDEIEKKLEDANRQ